MTTENAKHTPSSQNPTKSLDLSTTYWKSRNSRNILSNTKKDVIGQIETFYRSNDLILWHQILTPGPPKGRKNS